MWKNLINLSNLVVRPDDKGYCTEFSANWFKVVNKQTEYVKNIENIIIQNQITNLIKLFMGLL